MNYPIKPPLDLEFCFHGYLSIVPINALYIICLVLVFISLLIGNTEKAEGKGELHLWKN